MKSIVIVLVFIANLAFAFDCVGLGPVDCGGFNELNRPSCSADVCTYPTAPDTTGTGTISSTGTAVTGSGTDFVNQINPGWVINAGSQNILVASITDATHLTTSAPFTPVISAGTSYTVRPPIGSWDSPAGNPLFRFTGDGRIGLGITSPAAFIDVLAPAAPSGKSVDLVRIQGTQASGFDTTPGSSVLFATGYGSSGNTTVNGGDGGPFTVTTGRGGNATGGTAVGGAGGPLSITTGNGGSGTGSNASGGNGADITFTAGDGGTKSGSGTGGSGGNVIITSGVGKNGSANGDVKLATAAGNVIIGGPATASKLELLEPSGSGTNVTTFSAVAQAADINYTLPPAVATVANAPLVSDTSGALSFMTVSVPRIQVFSSTSDANIASATDVEVLTASTATTASHTESLHASVRLNNASAGARTYTCTIRRGGSSCTSGSTLVTDSQGLRVTGNGDVSSLTWTATEASPGAGTTTYRMCCLSSSATGTQTTQYQQLDVFEF